MQWLKNCGKVSGALMRESGAQTACRWGWDADFCTTIRSREISASIILQSQSQLKTIYKDAADTIVGNCDTTLFLGGKEKSTLKEISELLGKETIDSFNQSENRGSQVSHGLNYQKLGKDMPYLLMKSSAALNLT